MNISFTTILLYLVFASQLFSQQIILDYQEQPLPPEPARPAPGILTAAEWSDLEAWDSWLELITEDFAAFSKSRQLYTCKRYPVEVAGRYGQSLPNVQLSLLGNNDEILWSALTDIDGKGELWSGFDQLEARAIRLSYRDIEKVMEKPVSSEEGVNSITLPADCPETSGADLLFVIDATGSMGDELAYLQAELSDIIRRVHTVRPDLEARSGIVFFRDRAESFLVKDTPLSQHTPKTISFLQQQRAGGGGQSPEAIEAALHSALGQDWDPQAAARLLFLITDAVPDGQPDVNEQLRTAIKIAAETGVKIIPIAASKTPWEGEFLFRTMAILTNSTYTFLTDDSGIGDRHEEPSASLTDQQPLGDLLFRIIVEQATSLPCSQIDTEAWAVEEHRNEKESFPLTIRYFPNPAAGTVFLQLEQDLDELLILNAQGQILHNRHQLTAGRHSVDASLWPAGVYFLEFRKPAQPDSKEADRRMKSPCRADPRSHAADRLFNPIPRRSEAYPQPA